MNKFLNPLIPSSRYCRIPYLNGSVINIGDWIRKWSCLDPRKRALIFGGRPFTYRELILRINQLCHRLLDLGVQNRDRVSVLLYNGRPYLEIFFALSRIGAILAPLNRRLPGHELEFIVRDSGPRMILFDPEFKDALASMIRPRLNLSNEDRLSVGSPCPARAKDYKIGLSEWILRIRILSLFRIGLKFGFRA